MLQRGTVVEGRNCECKGVIVGTCKGLPMIQLVDGNREPYNSREWKITSDFGCEEILDSAINDHDKAEADFMAHMTSISLVAMQNALEDDTVQMNELHHQIKQEQEKNKLQKRGINNLQAQLTDCRRRLDETNALINPATRYRVSIGTKEIVSDLAITEAAANDIAAKLSDSIRRQVIVEHICNGITVYASLWEGGKQVSV